MLYCDAFPVRKLLPLDRLVSTDPCLTCHYETCPFYLERLRARLPSERRTDEAPVPRRES
jgi:hypothetical protein